MAFLAEKLPESRICLCNDLTKTHERFYRGSAEEVLLELEGNPNAEDWSCDGEIVRKAKEDAEEAVPPSAPRAALIDAMIAGAETLRDAIEAVLESGNTPFKKNELKEAAIAIKSLFEE